MLARFSSGGSWDGVQILPGQHSVFLWQGAQVFEVQIQQKLKFLIFNASETLQRAINFGDFIFLQKDSGEILWRSPGQQEFATLNGFANLDLICVAQDQSIFAARAQEIENAQVRHIFFEIVPGQSPRQIADATGSMKISKIMCSGAGEIFLLGKDSEKWLLTF